MSHSIDVVTGGAGFIGCHLSRRLLEEDRRVRIVDNFSTGRRQNLSELQDRFSGRCEVFDLDVRDLDGLARVFDSADTVYHQAAIPSVQRSVENPIETNSANIDGTLNVFWAARQASVRKVVYAASSSAYGDSDELPKHERMREVPLSPYAISKFVGELYGRVFASIFELPTVGLRYFNVFGPRQDPRSHYAAVIPRFISRMLSGQPPVIYGDGEQSRDFTYIDNVVDANILAARAESRGTVFNVACGRRYTLNELVELLNEIIGTRFEAVYEAPRKGDVRHSLADLTLAREHLGYDPGVSFEEGLRRTVEWLRKSLHANQEG